MKLFFALLIFTCAFFLMRDPFHPRDLYTEIPKGSEQLTEVLPLLNQPYTYLAEGSQLIAFVSEDGKTVLKLFKKTHKQKFKLSRLIRAFTKDWQLSRRNWSHKFQDTCRRYKIAFAQLRDETGLIGLHFHHTKDPLFVTLKGRKTYRVDLSKHPFIVQKKATIAPVYARKHPEKARHALKELFQVRLDRGISDPRQTLSTNYGFIEGRAIQLDVGKIECFEGDREAELATIFEKVDKWIDGFPNANPGCP